MSEVQHKKKKYQFNKFYAFVVDIVVDDDAAVSVSIHIKWQIDGHLDGIGGTITTK